jgi:hypothetical protein
MAAPTNMPDAVLVTSQLQQFLVSYATIIANATEFVRIGNLLAANPNLSIASTPFKTTAGTILTQVSSFIQTAPAELPPY